MKPGKIVLLVVGSLVTLIGFGLLLAGGALGWAQATQRDDDGYFTTGTRRFETATPALHSQEVDLGAEPGSGDWLFDTGDLATLRVRVSRPAEGPPLFVGVARQADVDAYLAGVAHDEVVDLDFGDDDVEYRRQAGERPPAAPAEQTFWAAASTEGLGRQTLLWDVTPGRWALVVMNADGSPGLAVDLAAGVKIDVLVPVMIGLLVGGLLLLLIGVATIVAVAASIHRADNRTGGPGASGAAAPAVAARPEQPWTTAPAPSSTAADPAYPVRLEGCLDAPLSRWLWLVKWLLAVPHFIVLAFLWLAYVVLTVVAGLAILFTGRYPRRLFDFNVGVLRWTWRATYYATSAIATDRYPPFTLGPAEYPASFDVVYPERLSRGLVLVKWWLLVLPHYVVISLFTGGGWWAADRADRGWGIGLDGLLVLVAGVSLLFTRRYPGGVFNLLMGLNRWIFRVVAYASLMTDRYPPFRLDQGGSEPNRPSPPPTPAAPAAQSSVTDPLRPGVTADLSPG